MGKTIYVVSAGCYLTDDYRVIGIFSKKRTAEKLVKKIGEDGVGIEVWELDPIDEETLDNYDVWYVEFGENLKFKEVRKGDFELFMLEGERVDDYSRWWEPKEERYIVTCLAKNKDEAIKRAKKLLKKYLLNEERGGK